MNIELVYMILLGISSSMECRKIVSTDNSISKKISRTAIRIEEGHKNTKITFKGIKLQNIDLWNVDRKSMLGSIADDYILTTEGKTSFFQGKTSFRSSYWKKASIKQIDNFEIEDMEDTSIFKKKNNKIEVEESGLAILVKNENIKGKEQDGSIA